LFKQSKLEKLFNADEMLYETTSKDCKRWFRILNKEIFGKKLEDVDDWDIRWRRRYHAYYNYWEYVRDPEKNCSQMCMNKRYKSKLFFVEILAHEMIHHWQRQNGYQDDDHGPTFFAWQPTFIQKGLTLSKGY
jgi:hypothetical protein